MPAADIWQNQKGRRQAISGILSILAFRSPGPSTYNTLPHSAFDKWIATFVKLPLNLFISFLSLFCHTSTHENSSLLPTLLSLPLPSLSLFSRSIFLLDDLVRQCQGMFFLYENNWLMAQYVHVKGLSPSCIQYILLLSPLNASISPSSPPSFSPHTPIASRLTA